jgi:hypothetical protein
LIPITQVQQAEEAANAAAAAGPHEVSVVVSHGGNPDYVYIYDGGNPLNECYHMTVTRILYLRMY